MRIKINRLRKYSGKMLNIVADFKGFNMIQYENNFKVCSDEWSDRSLINSLIWCMSLELEQTEDTIKDDTEYIIKDIDNGYYPNLRCEHVLKHIDRCRKRVAKLKAELKVLTTEGVSDKEKLEKYWVLHNRGFIL